jgi:nitrate/nitrite-specific signal transduction histidine kinase
VSDQTQERLQADIEAQRARLADTVDQLGHKLDVKAQAKAWLERVRPQQVALSIGAVVAVGLVVWWVRHR